MLSALFLLNAPHIAHALLGHVKQNFEVGVLERLTTLDFFGHALQLVYCLPLICLIFSIPNVAAPRGFRLWLDTFAGFIAGVSLVEWLLHSRRSLALSLDGVLKLFEIDFNLGGHFRPMLLPVKVSFFAHCQRKGIFTLNQKWERIRYADLDPLYCFLRHDELDALDVLEVRLGSQFRSCRDSWFGLRVKLANFFV